MNAYIKETNSKIFKNGYDVVDENNNIIVEAFELKEWATDWAIENGYNIINK